MILPPSRLMSLSRKDTSCAAQASWTLRRHSSRASTAAGGPPAEITASVLGELDERHRDLAVFGLARGRQQVGTHRRWQQSAHVDRVIRAIGHGEVGQHRRRPQHPAGAHGRAERGRVQQRGGGIADHDLTGGRERFHLGGDTRRRPADQQFPMERRVADQEEMEQSAVDADRHSQRDPPRGGAGAPDAAQHRAHPVGGACRVRGMVGPAEEQEDRVAAPLDQVGAVRAGGVEQRGERPAQDVAHLLGADLSLAGEPFGERGESRDVGQGHRRRRVRGAGDSGCWDSHSVTNRGT